MINLTSNDSAPSLAITLKNANTGEKNDPDTWDPIDVSSATVLFKFRRQGEQTLIDTMTCINENDGTDGKVIMIWSATALQNLTAGLYEAEIEIDFGVTTQTVFDTIEFNVRDDF